MARRRTRLKRFFLLLVALALLVLLLELNRFLPGGWPGGGGGGLREGGASGGRNASEAGRQPDDADDPAAVAPPEEPPPAWPPKEGVLLEVRGPDGELATGWRLGIGGSGAEEPAPDEEGARRVRDKRVHALGFRIRVGKGAARHRRGLSRPAARWSVRLPSTPLPPRGQPRGIALRVVDARSGAALRNAEIRWTTSAGAQLARTDGDGMATLPTGGRDEPIEAVVSKTGHALARAWLDPRDLQRGPLALEPLDTMDVKLAIPGDARTSVVELVAADGTVYEIPRGADADRYRHEAPAWLLRDAWLVTHIDVGAPKSVPFTVRHRLSSPRGTVTVPPHRVVEVRVRDDRARPRPGATVLPRYSTADDEHAEGEPTTRQASVKTLADGTARIAVPRDRPFALLIEAPGSMPIVRQLTRTDGNARLEFVTKPGLHLPVRVLDAAGRPVPDARVVGRASPGGMRLLRETRTGSDGRAALGPFGAGYVEAFAVAPGHAWTATTTQAHEAMGTVELRLPRGYPLTIVVEDPFGLPLADVDVELAPADGGRPLISAPDAEPQRTGADGTLVIDALPDRLYDVTLTLPGRANEKLRKVRPGAVTYFATLVKRAK